MSNNKQSSIDFYRIESQKLMIKAIRKEITEKEWRLSENKLGEQAKAMHKEEIDAKIQKAIEKFEEAKNKASTLRDVVYLDGVLSILDTIKNETFGE